LARRFKQLYSIYQQNQDLISIGAYRRGSDPAIDEAIDKQPQLANFLMQSMAESYSVEQSLEGLKTALEAV